MEKCLTFIAAYEAEKHITGVLNRLPSECFDASRGNEVLLIDDCSTDATTLLAQQYHKPICLYRTPRNLGYGGNQRLGYGYAVQRGFKSVVLIHGDGQYAPEMIPQMIEPIDSGRADVVLGSRMLERRNALRGGMPLYKFVGNIILTKLQNKLLGSDLSEFHTGLRAWSVRALRQLPFVHNSSDFDFDTQILIQSIDKKLRIAEIPIPTHYGDEICRVNGLRYAMQIMVATVRSRLQRYGIGYDARYDYSFSADKYDLPLPVQVPERAES